MKVNVDMNSGFCFGVQFAIDRVEDEMKASGPLYSLGDIVHNAVEVERLEKLGLKTITIEEFKTLKNTRVFIRAHGEPPSTYKLALENNIELIDATCPVVMKLQQRIKEFYDRGYQVLIYGREGHPEVIGLCGQCNNEAIVLKHADLSDRGETEKIDFSRKTVLFSQTTKDTTGFYELKANLENVFREHHAAQNFDSAATESIVPDFQAKDTICRQVSNRDQKLAAFSKENECVIFVAGRKSSNGKVLFEVCKDANSNTHFIENQSELERAWFLRPDDSLVESVGVCGATSTPMWVMQQVAEHIRATFAAERFVQS
ncbi:hydroxymethylbutenyl pyrophosphate reductase [Chloroherpeton thalassium ATCC 35110]|uniref:4-hydroxy-3-methylbut-2-enyl diphosphate reductase n=1 Tax=Chloroherpeton thalassium (strain ATCC 35110 / GB-78) TaxID=517418 RepID=ISPH_CHLT3|nr:4-hydroxy-3-methylbut-2-enyl diphosphate reductase [Chloroherpeton thalassium]B3QSU2.1 RecName: Full=4-hydroxy-3-methylbut-2-enyl diphosphate reductase; Short=HMBPP reductase [Chloroherpeton thalassium ATCC 35110]ACF12585.1 hydroxymethylbutenyl pyrophosphate reductase [Chloroherpeton thalassium ATCC 35110]